MKLIEAGNGQKTDLMERHQKGLEKFQRTLSENNIRRDTRSLGIKEWKKVLKFGEMTDAGFVPDFDFSIKSFREASYAAHRKMGLLEANAEGTFGPLLRAGIQNQFNDIYLAVPVTYQVAVREVSSNKRQEFYAPLERAGFPKRVEAGGSFPESTFKGLDVELINVKWGQMLNFERELIDDDQTGQMLQRVSDLSENARIFEEYYVWNRLMNKTGASLDGEPLPVSDTYSTVYSSTGLHGTGNGVNATTAGRLSQTQIQNGKILADNMKDQSGRPMMVIPKYLAVSTQDQFFATVLLGSSQNPSMSSTQTADIGKVGGIMGKNPIQSLVAVIVSRAIPAYGALLIDPKGFAFQRRDATELVQENPQSGPAFSQEVFRYKLRTRWESDFIDPKFYINLNTSFASS